MLNTVVKSCDDAKNAFLEYKRKWLPIVKNYLSSARLHDYAIFIPCAKKKPFHMSISHKSLYLPVVRELKKKGVYLDIYIVSEPALIVPYKLLYIERYCKKYLMYDFPPKIVVKCNLVNLFARLLSEPLSWIDKLNYKLWIVFLPKHHRIIFQKALKLNSIKTSIVFYYPKNPYFTKRSKIAQHLLSIIMQENFSDKRAKFILNKSNCNRSEGHN